MCELFLLLSHVVAPSNYRVKGIKKDTISPHQHLTVLRLPPRAGSQALCLHRSRFDFSHVAKEFETLSKRLERGSNCKFGFNAIITLTVCSHRALRREVPVVAVGWGWTGAGEAARAEVAMTPRGQVQVQGVGAEGGCRCRGGCRCGGGCRCRAVCRCRGGCRCRGWVQGQVQGVGPADGHINDSDDDDGCCLLRICHLPSVLSDLHESPVRWALGSLS